MNSVLIGTIGVVVIVLIAEGVSVFLRRPLGILLKVEKGSERSDFWSAYIRVVLVLVPAAFALLSFPDATRRDIAGALVDQLRWGIAGLLITLAFAGKAVRVPAPARYSHAPYMPPIVPPPPPAPAGPAR
ncbi:MAG: hypothetical protein HY010_14310 [Acidobacteria bacterium]|nr:hypothetical protein [Acidobacteriota bacterium]